MNGPAGDGRTGCTRRMTSPAARNASSSGCTSAGSVVPTRSVGPTSSTHCPEGSFPRMIAIGGGAAYAPAGIAYGTDGGAGVAPFIAAAEAGTDGVIVNAPEGSARPT